MHTIIDGYNLLFSIADEGEVKDFQEERDALIAELAAMAAVHNSPITVVFDAPFSVGASHRSHRMELEIVYTDEEESADAYIIEMVERSRRPQECTVVTSDRSLGWHIRRLGGKTIGSAAFMQKVRKSRTKQKAVPIEEPAPKKEKPKAPSARETEEERWLRLFEARLKKIKEGDGA